MVFGLVFPLLLLLTLMLPTRAAYAEDPEPEDPTEDVEPGSDSQSGEVILLEDEEEVEPGEEPVEEDVEEPVEDAADDAAEDDDEPVIEETIIDEPVAEDAPPQSAQPLIRSIVFRGNRRVTDEQILAVMRTRPGQPFSPAGLQDDLRRIAEMGFFVAAPDKALEYAGGGVKVTIVVEENPLFTYAQVDIIRGPGLYPEGDLARAFTNNPDFPLIAGQLISRQAIEAGIVALQNVYRNEGYTAATVVNYTLMTEGPDTGVVKLEVNEGVIKEVRIVGNSKTDDAVIRREITLVVGEVYNARALLANLRALYNLQLFEDIAFEPEFTEEGELIVVLKFIEARTGQLGFGVGYSSQDGILGTLSYAERNFRGKGESIRASGQFGGPSPEGTLSYFIPYIDSYGTSIGVEIFRQSFTDTERDPEDPDLFAEYDTTRTGAEVKSVYPISDILDATVALKFLNGDISLNPESTADLIDISEFARRGLLDGTSNSITLGLIRDTRDFVVDPSTGSVASLTSNFFGGPLGGDFDAIKITGEFKRYWRLSHAELDPGATAATLPSNHVFAFRMMVGGAEGGLSLLDRFELGGQNSIRGTEFAIQTGDKALLANFEYRFPVITNLSGAVFLDTGTAAPPGQTLSLGDLITTVGAGIRYRIPFFGVAPLRVDYGFDLENGDSRVVLGFGQLF